MTCRKVKRKGSGHKPKRQKCTIKLVSGPVRITTAGRGARAKLTRHGRVYARGTPRLLRATRRVLPGRYTLRLSHAGKTTSIAVTVR